MAAAFASRKVRAPKGMALDNVQEERSYGKCHRKQTASRFGGR
jgi:hypothetical protein